MDARVWFGGDEAARDSAVAAAASTLRWVTMAFGLAGLAAAVAFDLRDPHRLGRASANAFWLHAAAGPALAFCTAGAFVPIRGLGDGIGLGAAIAALVVAALIVDRRALVLSATAYVLISIVDASPAFAVATGETATGGPIAALGGGVIVLGLGWTGLRRRLMAALPGAAWKRWLPPTG